MEFIKLSLFAAIIAWSLPVSSSCARPEGKESKGRVLLMFAQEKYHDWRENVPVMREVLENKGFTVVMSEDPWVFTTAGMKDFDAVVLQFRIDERWPAPVEKAFLNLVRGGMGISIVHSADNSFTGWSEFEDLVGLLWRDGTAGHDHYGPYTVKIVDKEHFITAGLEDFPVTDELYRDLTKYSDFHVLAEAFSQDKQADYPILMVKNYGKGRVFHTVLGHDSISIRSEGFQQTMEHGILWTMGKGEKILVNHVGFLPRGAKFCMMAGTVPVNFQVVERKTGRTVFTGRMTSKKGDLGKYLVGDFSRLTETGVFSIQTRTKRSGEFRIAENVYEEAIRKSVKYFSVQRCGPSTTGYNAPCHVDDGIRVDNGQYQDVSGGWHDATDVRKWVSATLYGMIGLYRVKELLRPAWDKGQIIEELRWGNRYFLKMQEPDGYVMNHIGDVFTHGDQNRWTDNLLETHDNRYIQTDPCSPMGQFCFIAAQAAVTRLTRKNDPDYAARCREAALSCLEWCKKEKLGGNPNELGSAIVACIELHRSLGGEQYRDLAINYARLLLDLQVREPVDSEIPIRGFFRASSNDPEPYRDIIWHGCWHLMGLCELLERFPDHPEAGRWQNGIELYCREYLARMSELNPFGIVPYGLYSKDPGGSRKVGNYWYRWFMEIDRQWWVGINANLASAGIGLLRASRLLQDKGLAAVAQRQLDWILGVNPFNTSTIIGVGYNNPKHYDASFRLKPAPPVIPGAVPSGIAGTEKDQPDLKNGSWQTCEYWTPMVCYAMWLMSELL